MKRRKRLFPILDWLPSYKRSWIKGDVVAGLTVGVMLIPQGMAYAMIAGLPPVYGLYAGLVPQVMYAIFGTSRQLGVGPVAMDSLLVASALGSLALVDQGQYIIAALFMALLVGILQLVMGGLRLGFLVNFLSRPVVSGFTSAAAIIIGLSQLKHLLGVNISNTARLHEISWRTIKAIPETNMYAVIIGIATLVLIVLIRKYGKGIPSALVVVAMGTFITSLTGWSELGLPIVGTVPGGLPDFAVPGIDTGLLRPLLPLAITLALIGYMESISIARGIQENHTDYEIDANQELIALGMANIAGSLFGSYNSTASFSRSAINDDAGAKTGVAALISAIIIGITLLYLTPLFYYLPNAVLGAIIFAAVFKLVNVRYAVSLWHGNRREAILLLITFLVTLTFSMVAGILVGIFASLAYTVYRDSTPHIAELGRVRGTDYFRNITRFADDIEVRPDVLLFRFDAPIFFGNAGYFKDELLERIEKRGSVLKTIVFNCEAITYIDSTGHFMLTRLIVELQREGYRVIFSGAIGPVREVILSGAIGKLVGSDYMFVRSSEVLDFLDGIRVPSDIQRKIAWEGKRELPLSEEQ